MINLQEVRTKFIAKISSFGKDAQGNPRYIIILPKEQIDEGKYMKGKHLWVTLETIDDENNEDHKKTNMKKVK